MFADAQNKAEVTHAAQQSSSVEAIELEGSVS
jgi:hypothetical protein